ncbi:MAG: hypothetical protein AB7I41_14045 [Candidatus Sericytochromatia bacterium]
MQPQIDSNYFPYLDETPPDDSANSSLPNPPEIPASLSYFPLELGKSKEEIQAILDKNNEIKAFPGFEFAPSFYSSQLISQGEYQIFQVKVDVRVEGYSRSEIPKHLLPDPMGLYILKNGISIGYCVVDPLEIYLPNKFEIYQNITRLVSDKNYLQGELLSHPQKELDFFSPSRQDVYTERYATLTLKMNPQELLDKMVGSKHHILMRSFYPAELENLVQPYLKAALNEHLQKYASWNTP